MWSNKSHADVCLSVLNYIVLNVAKTVYPVPKLVGEYRGDSA